MSRIAAPMPFVPAAKRMTLKQKGPIEDNMSVGLCVDEPILDCS